MPLDDSLPVNGENHIPAAVRRASQRADEIARELGIAGVPPVEEAEPAAEEQHQETPEAAAEVQEPAAAPAPVVDEPDWKQRFHTLQGKYESEGASLRGQMASLERLIATMQETPRTEAPARPVTTTTVVEATPEDIEAYGEDLVKAVQRWVNPAVQPLLAQIETLRGEIDRLRGGQQQIHTETVQDRVFRTMDADPEIGRTWRETNNDPEFIAWLQVGDPLAGLPRLQLLRNAFDQGDATRVGRFFKAYLAEHTAVSQPPAPAPVHTTPQGEADGRPSLESLAAPGRAASSGQPPGAPEKRVWTRQQIAAFYKDCSTGKYAGREAEKTRLEQDIFDAAPEGRIR